MKEPETLTAAAQSAVVVVDHPLVQHKLGMLRDDSTPTHLFRELVDEVTLLLTYEATKALATEEVETLQPVEYYVKLPADVAERDVILLDPMLATGNSTAAAVATVKSAGATSVRLIAIIAAPEGIERLHSEHPDVNVVVAAVDRGLNEKGYIVPGLGDAGDRLFGTK